MWIGIGFEKNFHNENWQSYGWQIRHNPGIVAYYGGRKVTHYQCSGKNDVDIRKEDISKLGLVVEEHWDGGYGMIQGCNKILSELLEWYGTGDCVSLLLDLETSILRFFKNDRFQAKVVLKDVIPEFETKKFFNVFGAVDDTDDVIVYDRQLWPNHQNPELFE